jgi:hypothetical protein
MKGTTVNNLLAVHSVKCFEIFDLVKRQEEYVLCWRLNLQRCDTLTVSRPTFLHYRLKY